METAATASSMAAAALSEGRIGQNQDCKDCDYREEIFY
jgi:hypothetical protein